MKLFRRKEKKPVDVDEQARKLATNLFESDITRNAKKPEGRGRQYHNLDRMVGGKEVPSLHELDTSVPPTALEISHALIDAFHKELDRGYYGGRGKSGCTFYKNAVKFMNESGVIPRLSLYDLALYTVCKIRYQMKDSYSNQQQMMASVNHPDTISELRSILHNSQEGGTLDRDMIIGKFFAVYGAPLPQLDDKIACTNSNLERELIGDFLAQPQFYVRDEQEQTQPQSFDEGRAESIPVTYKRPPQSFDEGRAESVPIKYKRPPKKGIQQVVVYNGNFEVRNATNSRLITTYDSSLSVVKLWVPNTSGISGDEIIDITTIQFANQEYLFVTNELANTLIYLDSDLHNEHVLDWSKHGPEMPMNKNNSITIIPVTITADTTSPTFRYASINYFAFACWHAHSQSAGSESIYGIHRGDNLKFSVVKLYTHHCRIKSMVSYDPQTLLFIDDAGDLYVYRGQNQYAVKLDIKMQLGSVMQLIQGDEVKDNEQYAGKRWLMCQEAAYTLETGWRRFLYLFDVTDVLSVYNSAATNNKTHSLNCVELQPLPMPLPRIKSVLSIGNGKFVMTLKVDPRRFEANIYCIDLAIGKGHELYLHSSQVGIKTITLDCAGENLVYALDEDEQLRSKPLWPLFGHTNQERAEHMAASVNAAIQGTGLDYAAVTAGDEVEQAEEVVVETFEAAESLNQIL